MLSDAAYIAKTSCDTWLINPTTENDALINTKPIPIGHFNFALTMSTVHKAHYRSGSQLFSLSDKASCRLRPRLVLKNAFLFTYRQVTLCELYRLR